VRAPVRERDFESSSSGFLRLDARPTDELRFRPREAKGVVALAYAPEVSEGFEALAAVIGARMRVLAEKSV